MLADLLYGDVACREYCDLACCCRPRILLRDDLLAQQAMSWICADHDCGELLRAPQHYHCEMTSADGRFAVELLEERSESPVEDGSAAWGHRLATSPSGNRVAAFSPEELMLF